jgi:predicted metal-binding membrane protein
MLHHWHHSQSLPLVAAGWTAMMALMMAPTVAPWVVTYDRVLGAHDALARRVSSAALFALGYLAAWSVFAIGAAFVQLATDAPAQYAGAILVGAGLFQLSPMKQACLSHCRNPLTYLLMRWHGGPSSGLRLGFLHGLYCLGCCWALMLTALAMGVMNVTWMAALALMTFVEQVMPRGARLRVPLGVVLVALGLWRW